MNRLLLNSGNEIPFLEAQISIHPPTIREIAYIGEDAFYSGAEMLTFSKDILSKEDRNNLIHQTDFDVLMSMITDNNGALQKNKLHFSMVLALLFPEHQIKFGTSQIALFKEGECHSITNKNFDKFKEIVSEMFCLNGLISNTPKYNPGGKLAAKLAEQFKDRHRKLAEFGGGGGKEICILDRYVSILSVGLRMDKNILMNYTVYQLFDEMERFRLKEDHDNWVKAKMAGARDLKDVEDWMKDMHAESAT